MKTEAKMSNQMQKLMEKFKTDKKMKKEMHKRKGITA